MEVIGGASAGGMTAAITAAAIQSPFAPVTSNMDNSEEKSNQNPLYNGWVNLKEEDGKDMMACLLSTDDIESDLEFNKHKEVRAGFNSSFINDIAGMILDKRVEAPYHRPYIADDADIFTTITNLRGFSYRVQFETSMGPREHRMKMHRDYAFFRLGDRNNNDGRIPVNFNSPSGLNTHILKQAALATGAFPVGLESRDLTRRNADIRANKYLNLMLSGKLNQPQKVTYDFLPPGDEFLSLNVDGGVINNEPYDMTQQLLNDRRNIDTADLKTSASEFDSMVLMIDPFPNDDEEEATVFTPKKAWRHVVPSILSAMLGQLTLKDEQIKRAYLSDDYTRYLIMPVRHKENGEREKYTIACGSLGGFGGFLSKEFRKHDFFLGRRNCQQFLQRHLNVPEDAKNPILEFGYRNVERSKYTVSNKGINYLPVIPDIRINGDETNGYSVVRPSEEMSYGYPHITLSYLLGLKPAIERRIKCILDNIQNVAEQKMDDKEMQQKWKSMILPKLRKKSFFRKLFDNVVRAPFLNAYLWLGKTASKGTIANMFIDIIITDMEKRGLIVDDEK
ncbi:hypothetical protein [Arcticibacter sp. MXS-1]|uniref:hypothetical protein n=1 Tax=Arcticibacter sp. MXS-1 TaxID=3341726 RepID=UPI0035A933B1